MLPSSTLSSPRSELMRIIAPLRKDDWEGFMGLVEIPHEMVDRVMKSKSSHSRLYWLRRSLETLTGAEVEDVINYLHSALQSYLLHLSDPKVVIPPYKSVLISVTSIHAGPWGNAKPIDLAKHVVSLDGGKPFGRFVIEELQKVIDIIISINKTSEART